VRENAGLVTITPAQRGVVHVAVYNPAIAYGLWPLPPDPQPLLAVLPAAAGTGVMGASGGVEVAALGPLWAWARFDWSGRAVVVDQARYAAIPGAHVAVVGAVVPREAGRGPARPTVAAQARPRVAEAAQRHRVAHQQPVVHHHNTAVAARRPPPPPPWAVGPAPVYPPMPPQIAMGGPYGYGYGYGPR
jgi:hypothetical protein